MRPGCTNLESGTIAVVARSKRRQHLMAEFSAMATCSGARNDGRAWRRHKSKQLFVRMRCGYVRIWPIVLKKSFLADGPNFSGPLMRSTRGDVRDHINLHNATANRPIGLEEPSSGGETQQSTFARFS